MTELSSAVEDVELANGLKMPMLGFGYRHIDTASIYKNEEQVARAIAESGVPRSDIFITSKLQPKDHGEKAYAACLDSLKRLGTDYLDCYLIHWPGVGGMKLDDPAIRDIRKATWQAFERLYKEGRCKAIGVSNFMPHHLKELAEAEWCTVTPMVNQFEIHPMLQQREAVAASRSLNIRVEAYSSLARGKPELHTNAVVVRAAEAHGVTVGQVLLRWGIQHGYIVIPKSSRPERIEENFKVFGWQLTESEMREVDALDGHLRTCWDPTTVVV